MRRTFPETSTHTVDASMSDAPAVVRAQGLGVCRGEFSIEIKDFALLPGDRLALLGPSGVGKTTFLETLALLRPAARGELSVLGQAASGLARRAARSLRAQGIGLSLADLALLPHLTVAQNVALPLNLGRAPGHAVAEVLAALGLAGLASRRPADLSQGERQRACLARALVGAPRLVLADEPTAHLDAATAERTLDGLLSLLHPQAALVLVTHDPPQAARCTRQWRWGS
jgi:putative ABC transport system ATP-binding protein